MYKYYHDYNIERENIQYMYYTYRMHSMIIDNYCTLYYHLPMFKYLTCISGQCIMPHNRAQLWEIRLTI